MKKALLILAAAGVLAPTFAQAQAQAPAKAKEATGVTVYGLIDASIDRIDDDADARVVRVHNNSSRLGFRGVEDLGNGMKAIFGIEAGFNVDNGAFTSTASQFRNTYAALTTSVGAFAIGRLDSSNPTGSPLYSQRTRHIDAPIHDSGVTAFGTKVLNQRNRVSNAVGYMSPTYAGLNMRARYWQSGPEVPLEPGFGVRNEDDFTNLDVGINYEAGAFGAGIGYGSSSKRGGLLANDFKNKLQVVGSYDFKVINTYGIYGRDNFNGTATTRDDVDYWLVGASAPVSKAGTVIANYMRRDVQRDRNGELRKFHIAYGHKLSKRTQLYAIYDREDPNSNVANNVVSAVSIGVQHKF